MIALYQQTEDPPQPRGMVRARRLVASALLRRSSRRADGAVAVRGWKAWLFTTWVVVVTAAYFAYMIGWS